MILAVIAILPLLLDRVRAIESDRAERIEAASKQALMLAHQGVAAQNEAIISVRAFMQVAASAHGLMTARGERCNHFLSDAVRQVSWLKSLSLVEPNGQIICSSNTNVIGVDISQLPHFKRAMKTGDFALSDYFVGRVTGPTLLTALPHRAPDGSIDAVVSAPLQLGWFTHAAGVLAELSGAAVMLVDRSGTLLAHQPNPESWVGRNFADHALILAMSESAEGVFTGESLDGVRRIFGFVELPGTGTRLAVGMGTCGRAVGARETFEALRLEVKRRGLPFAVVAAGCNGMCWAQPVVEVLRDGRPRLTTGHVAAAEVPRLLNALAA